MLAAWPVSLSARMGLVRPMRSGMSALLVGSRAAVRSIRARRGFVRMRVAAVEALEAVVVLLRWILSLLRRMGP